MLLGERHPCREVFRTPRLTVREIRVEDVDWLFTLYGKPGAADYMEPLYPYEEEVAYTENYIEWVYGFYGYGMWVVERTADGERIGRVGADDKTMPETGRILEMGYLIDPDFQRQGYGTEACVGTIRYFFEELAEEELTCLIHPKNHGSKVFAGKLGFSYRETLDLPGKRMERWDLPALHWREKYGMVER